MITRSEMNPLLSAAAEFALAHVSCSDITEAEDVVTQIARAVATTMSGELDRIEEVARAA